jgi:ribonuclease HII
VAPSLSFEQALHKRGHSAVAGIDEAGRGCWAGPVVAAAVVLGPQALARPELMAGVDDSKVLSAAQREAAYTKVVDLALGVGLGIVPSYMIDAYGIVPATRMAMTVALLNLGCPCDALLIDALPLPLLALPQTVLIRGDSQALSIAAASVVAKVSRDRLMRTAELAYPGYGFAAHKGYGTALHQAALARLGPTPIHRMTFQPLLDASAGQGDKGILAG